MVGMDKHNGLIEHQEIGAREIGGVEQVREEGAKSPLSDTPRFTMHRRIPPRLRFGRLRHVQKLFRVLVSTLAIRSISLSSAPNDKSEITSPETSGKSRWELCCKCAAATANPHDGRDD
jgi:hypothetical protein